MGVLPYIIVICIWFFNITGVLFLQYVDAIVIALVLCGIYKPHSLVLSAVFVLGILSDVIFNTVFGIHSAVYLAASVLWMNQFYKRYATHEMGYYLILVGFMVATQLVFGVERYISLWTFGVLFEYVIKGIYTASLLVFIDIWIPRLTPQQVRQREAV